MKILVVGSSNTDFVVRTKLFPKPGETVIGNNFFMNPGGKGANQAIAAARLGAAVTFACKVGDDVFGEKSKDMFMHYGIDTRYVMTVPNTSSGVALITVDEKAENNIVVASGANSCLTPQDMDDIDDFSQYGIVLTQLETPIETVLELSYIAKRHNVPFVLNPAPATRLPKELLENIDTITPNEKELGVLADMTITDDRSVEVAASKLIQFGIKNVIVTLGSSGAMAVTSEGALKIPAYHVNAIDTTGAGDVFNGAFVVAMSESMPIKKAMIFASAAAAISVTRLGAQQAAPDRKEVEVFLT